MNEMTVEIDHRELAAVIRQSLTYQLSAKLGIGLSEAQAEDISRNVAQAVVLFTDRPYPITTDPDTIVGDVVETLRQWRPYEPGMEVG